VGAVVAIGVNRVPEIVGAVGTLGFNFQAILPLLARFTFEGGASAYSALVCAMAVGAVVGAVATGARGRATPGLLAGAAIGFGALALLAAGAPSLALELAVLAPLGAASVTLAASINSALQLASDPAMRGRVMALYLMIFMGGTPLGSPIVGWVGETFGARWTLIGGGAMTILGTLVAVAVFSRTQGLLDPEINDRPRLLAMRTRGGAGPGT